MPANVPGIHHVTCITGDVQKCVDFYVGVLGLRFIKKTVNFDVPDTYHIYFGDYLGTPGSAMTFFGWPHLPWRPAGSGQVTVVSFAIPERSTDFWAGRLRQLDVEVERTSRFDIETLVVKDFDGIQIELVGDASDERWRPWPDGPVDAQHQIRSFHSVTLCEESDLATVNFLTETMGFRKVASEGSRTRFETGAGGPRAVLDVLDAPEAPVGEEAAGTVHHVAWRATNDAHELDWREVLVKSGRNVTPVIERKYFRSIYFREPGGVLFEIATDQPGFTVDEPADSLGSALQLPPQYEGRREDLKFNLPPIVVPTTAARGAGH
ncbi:MAG TPA: ring-cleaving dioxygenase [Candidatus Dormibacteraeota bacterium]